MIYQIKVNDETVNIRAGLRFDPDIASQQILDVADKYKEIGITDIKVIMPGGGTAIDLSGSVKISDIQTALRENLY